MTTTIVLAVGDSDLSDALDINDGVNYFPVPSTLKLPPPKVRTFRSRHLGTTQTIDAFREITLDIDVLATSDAELIDFYCRPIERKLEQARANSGSTPEDPRGVCLWLGMGSSSGLVYFDVDDGDLTWTRNDAETGATPAFTLTLYLKCKPYARGKPVTYTLPTLTIGANSYAFLPQLPGDAPGLCQWQLTDASNGSVAIDTYRIGTYSMEKLGSGDYVPWIAADPYGAGTLFADTSALNGATCARLTLSGAYKNMAIVRQPAGVAREAGKFDAFLLCRDSTAILTPPNDLAAADTGTLIAGLFGWVTQIVLVVTAVDASGNESFASPPVALAYRGDHIWTFTWNNPGFTTPINYRLYGYNLPPSAASSGTGAGNGIWQYRQLPGTATSYTSSSGTPFYSNVTGMVSQNPPSSGSTASAGAVIQPYLGVVAAGGQPQAFIAAPAVQTVVGSSKWELVPLGMYPLPSIATFEGQSALPWCVMVAAGYLGIGTPTFDIGGILLLKHEQPSNETQIGAAGNGAPMVTTIETNRREQVGAAVAAQYLAPSRTNLVAEYLMNQGSGTSLTDTSGSGNTGVLQTGTGWALDTTIQGVTGPSNCLTVAGGSGVTIATLTNIPIGNSNYTFAVLVRPTANGGWPLQWGANTTNNTTGTFLDTTFITHDWWANNVVANLYVLNSWHLITGTWDGTTRRLYLDGVLVAHDTPAAHAATAANFRLGFQLTGKLGPVRIWSRAISAFEVASYQGMLPTTVGQATSIGKLFLGPGNALVTFDADIAAGVHDTTNAKVQPTLRFTPRYHTLKGLLG